MGIVVQKYGGTSVATPDRIRDVARRVTATAERDHRVVVVVSAMGDTTDRLMEQAQEISRIPHARELDMLLSAGERISMSLRSMAIIEMGHEAISLTGSQAGIVTDTTHTKARIVDVRARRILEDLDAGKIVIVAGFQGVSTTSQDVTRSEEHTSELQSQSNLVCRLLLEKKNKTNRHPSTLNSVTAVQEMYHSEQQTDPHLCNACMYCWHLG